MTMNYQTFRLPATLLLAILSIGAAQAQTYQWKDRNGNTIISDSPPPGSAKEKRTIGAVQPRVVTEKAAEAATEGGKADAPKTAADKDLDFKKRQQEAKEKAEKQAKEQAGEAERQQNCERARRNLAALESDQPMVTLDEKGQRQTMDNAQRTQELDRARRYIAEACSKQP